MRSIGSGMRKSWFNHIPKSQNIANKFESKYMSNPNDVTSKSLVETLNDIVKETKGVIIGSGAKSAE